MNRRADAAAAGQKRFHAAEPCKRDGDTERYTVNGACITCSKARSAEQYRKFQDLLKKIRAKV